MFFVQNEKLAFWREKRKKKGNPKNTPLSRCCVGLPEEEALTKAGFSLLVDQNRVVVIRDAEEVVVRFLAQNAQY